MFIRYLKELSQYTRGLTPPAAILASLTAINTDQEVILCVVLLHAQLSVKLPFTSGSR